MSSLLLRNLRTILTCDDGDAVLEHADLYCENGIIRGLGPDLPQTADTVIDPKNGASGRGVRGAVFFSYFKS